MRPDLFRIFSAFLLTSIFIVLSAGATIMDAGTVLQPSALPLTPLEKQTTTVKIVIIPSGATTFSKDHSLQMQTGLTGAAWNIQMYVDGRAAAQVPAEGDAAFVNGYLLSYGTNHDVTLSVTVAGTVPAIPGQQVILADIRELDNSGSTVPGSSITISEPVAGPAPLQLPAVGGPVTAPSPGAAGTVPAPTRAGTGPVAALAAGCGALAIGSYRRI